jgi:uncharacterized protein (UPF0335 family)
MTDPYNITAEQLRSIVERYEALEEEKKTTLEHQKQVLAEAKSNGYDTAVLRRIIAERKKDPDQLAEEEAILEIYRQALEANYD